MLEDYFYENIPDLTTDNEKFCLHEGADILYKDKKFVPLTSDTKVEVPIQWGGNISYEGRAYGIQVSGLRFVDDLAWPDFLKEIGQSIMERYKGDGAQFLFVPYGEEVLPHKDLPGVRECAVSFPITQDNAPVDFYTIHENPQRKSLRRVYSYQYNKPVLLNTQKYHGIRAINKDRIVFQISYVMPYEEVKEMLLDIHDPRKCIGVIDYEFN